MNNTGIRVFEGAAAIVTGGASGIGRALAGELARRGAEVVLADLQAELAEEAAADIRAAGGKAVAAELDVTDFPAVERLVRDTVARARRLDYIFNNAGIVVGGCVERLNADDWNRIVDVNFRGVIHGIRAAYPVMLRQGFGHIVNTASAAGFFAGPGNAAYTATKAAVISLSASLRAESAAAGIRVSVICPGIVRTPILDGGRYGKMLLDVPPEALTRLLERFRPMAPDRFAKKALDAVARKRAIIVVPGWWKALWWLSRLSPALGLFFAQQGFQYARKIQKQERDSPRRHG